MRAGVVLWAAAAVASCSSGTSATPAPAPAPAGRPAPTAPTAPAGGGGGAAPAAPSAGALAYRTGGASYAYQRHDSITMQLPGGANQAQETDRTAYLTMAIAPEGALYRATVRLDSLRQGAAGAPIAPDSLVAAEGTRWTALLSPDGRLTNLRADRTNGIADQVGAAIPNLFPLLPPGGAREGASWSDTTQRTLRADAFNATEHGTTAYRATRSEGPALVIESRTAFQRSGSGGQGGQPMEMTSQGVRQATYRFGNGMVLSAEGADSAEMTITVPALGQSVPVSQRATWRISRLTPGR
jgi:hypothetical protein